MNSTFLSLAVVVVVLVFSMKMLADKEIRKTVACWTLIGISLGVCKSLLIQMTPQWLDTPLDSLIYQHHAQALFLHWTGQSVDANVYELAGLLNMWTHGGHPVWLPTDQIPYAGVFGSHEWIFSGLLGLWTLAGNSLASAIIANSILTGAFPAATYIITRELGGPPKVCHFAALLVALEPSIALNSAWLLKDTLATLLCMVVIISACQLCNKPTLKFASILAVSLGFLAAVKYVAFISFCMVFCVLALYFVVKKPRATAAAFVSASMAAVMIWGVLYYVPFEQKLTQPATVATAPLPPKATPAQVEQVLTAAPPAKTTPPAAPSASKPTETASFSLTTTVTTTLKAQATTLQGQTTTLTATANEEGADGSVIGWRSYLHDQPVSALARAVVRTLLAPYPWVALTHGLAGNNQLELYMLAATTWVIALPGTLLGLIIMARRNLKTLMLVALLGIIAVAYIVFFGEWSTRQRVFMMPVMYSFSALGWYWLWRMKERPRLRPALV
jgi:hypothetical protein